MLWNLQVETVDVHGGCGTSYVHVGGCGTYRQKSLCVCWRSETVDVHVGGQKLLMCMLEVRNCSVHVGGQKLLMCPFYIM